MRALVVVALALAAVACRTNTLENGDGNDGGPFSVDLARPPTYDLLGAKCDGLDDVISTLVNAAQTCSARSDCTIVATGCGLPGSCDTAVSTSTASALSAALSSWHAQGCDNNVLCAPCPPPSQEQPGCYQGRCRAAPTSCEEITMLFQALKASSGNSCATDADCVVTTGPCGLGSCRTVYSKSIQSDVNQLTGWWGNLSCPWNGGECAPCPKPGPAVCNAGRCQ